MSVKCIFKAFLKDNDGAVTVDWVMLTSGIVLLGVLVLGGIKTALGDASTSIADSISTAVASALT